jgi:hypothetical protein
MAETKHPVHKLIWKHFHFSGNQRPIPWGSSMRYTRDRLGRLFADAGYTVGAEVGVREGKFSRVLCKANPDLHLFCVDPWMPYGGRKYTKEKQDGLFEIAKKTLAPYNVTFIRKTSMEGVKDFKENSLDFVYIDGNHLFDFVMEDIIHWSRRVRSGGIIAAHDFHYGSNVEVVEACMAYTRANHIDPWYVTKEPQPTAYWVKP